MEHRRRKSAWKRSGIRTARDDLLFKLRNMHETTSRFLSIDQADSGERGLDKTSTEGDQLMHKLYAV
jgi:hypothetical protein